MTLPGWHSRDVHVREESGHHYPATLHRPPGHPLWYGLVKRVDPDSEKDKKTYPTPPAGSRWITVHGNGPEEEGHPVLITPNHDGSYTIIGGAGGKLNGLRFTGVKSEEEYKHLAAQKKEEQKNKEFARKAQEKANLGRQAYKELQEARKERKEQSRQVTRQEEDALVKQAAGLLGLKPEQLEVPKEQLEAIAKEDPEAAQKLVEEKRAENVRKAREVVDRSRGIIASAYSSVVTDTLGQVSASDISPQKGMSDGIGYRTNVTDLANNHGLTEETQERVAQKLRSEGPALPKPKPSEPKEKPAETAWDTAPIPTDNLSSLVDVVAAGSKVEAAKKQQRTVSTEVEKVQDAIQIPKAAVVIQKPMTDEEARKAALASIEQEAMQQAMAGLVEKTNELAGAGQALRRHFSAGANAVFNEVSQAVSGLEVDPLLSDTLGAQGTAAVLVARWRQELTPEQFRRLKDRLAEHHIGAQVKQANEATAKANAYLEEAEKLPSGEELDRMPIEAALAVHAQKVQYQSLAAEAAGVATGKLDAAAALNEALLKGPGKSIQVGLGKVAPERAVEMAFSIGLSDPVQEEGGPGNFSLHNDEGRMVMDIRPEGLRQIAGPVDKEHQERIRRSEAIKRGDRDEPGWLPAGISRRPRTTEREHPVEAVRLDNPLSIGAGDSVEEIAGKLRVYLGGRVHNGGDAWDAASDVASASFQANLDMDRGTQDRYQQALSQAIPPAPAGMSREEFKGWRENAGQQLEGYADRYVEQQRASGKMSDQDVALDKQRIAPDGVTRDCLYQAVHKDPSTAAAFKKAGELTPEDRRHIRDYAFQNLFKVDKGDESPTTPLSEGERTAWNTWRELEKQGDPYSQIQADMKKRSEEQGGLFGPAEPSPLSTVDLSDDTSVMQTAQKLAGALGYSAVVMPDGKKEYPELQTDRPWTTTDESGAVVNHSGRTARVVAQDARNQIRRALRAHAVGVMAAQEGIADSFNPESVHTASDRWTEYVQDMGGEKRAIQTVQEMMRSDVLRHFVSAYQGRTGRKLHVVERPVTHAEAHANAMLPAEAREARRRKLQSEMSGLRSRVRGRYAQGGVKEQHELQQQQQASQQTSMFGGEETAVKTTNVHRLSIGKQAENALAGMMPYINVSKPVEVAQDITLEPEQQRAIRLVLENKRQGVCLGTGVGKSLVAISSFAQARADGQAKRALFMVPSNIVAQFGGEFAKFTDPESGIRWHADPSASGDERRAAYANPDIHVCVTTPEAVREDITRAVAEDLSEREGKTITPAEATGRLAAMTTEQQDELIHGAMDKRSWNFDMNLQDEGHRLLSRQGKPDSHMQRIGDSIARKASHYVYSTADPAKSDASEVFSVLQKIDPQRYHEGNRDAFLRRYMRNTPAAREALRRETAPYLYAASKDFGVELLPHIESVEMPEEQKVQYDRIWDAYRTVRTANLAGNLDEKAVEALKVLSPRTFASGTPSQEVMKGKLRSAGIMRDAALDGVINRLPDGAKAQYVHNYINAHRGEPTVVFARSPSVLQAIKKKLEAGPEPHKVVILTGNESAEEKDRAKLAFSPPSGEATADVILCSDAGATGGNMQRGYRMLAVDNPYTAMTYHQRIGRELRTGQENDVQFTQLVANTGYDRAARRRVENKGELRELLTSPTEATDDSGIGFAAARALSEEFEEKYSSPGVVESEQPVKKALLVVRRSRRKRFQVKVRRAA